MRLILALTALAIVSTSAAISGELSRDTFTQAYNAGVHNGRLVWALVHCRGELTPVATSVLKAFRSLSEPGFEIGTSKGFREMDKAAEGQPRAISCAAVDLMYGEQGEAVKRLWAAR